MNLKRIPIKGLRNGAEQQLIAVTIQLSIVILQHTSHPSISVLFSQDSLLNVVSFRTVYFETGKGDEKSKQ